MWPKLILTALLSRINLYEVLFFILSNVKVPYIKRIRVSAKQVKILERKLAHGDFLFCRRDYFLKNLAVPGRYKHVGVWDAEKRVVIEFQDSGYVETPLALFCSRYTEVAATRCTNFGVKYRRTFISNMRKFSSKEYDNRFSYNTKSMYCSESCYHADSDGRLEYRPEGFFWLEVFIPNTLYELKSMERVFILNVSGVKLN